MANRPRLNPSDTAAINEACHWFFCLREGERSQADLDRWLASNPRHQQAWHWVTAAQQRFEPAQAPEIRQSLLQTQAPRRQTLKGLLLLAGAGGLGWGAVHWKLLPGIGPDMQTALGQISHNTLPDGSQLWLDTRSSVNIAFDNGLRRLIMGDGRILIQTASDPEQRPLVVDVPAGRITALGTRFSIHRHGAQVQVAVFEGAVKLENKNETIPAVIIQTGEQALFTPGKQATTQAAPNEKHATAWTRGLLIARDMPLQAFLTELSRYRRGIIRCEPALQPLKLLGIYPLNDTDAALEVLAHTLPVRIERPWPLWVSVEAR
ncbi:FecR domain-containing protein [Pseudomonas sp. S 311-6]|uniref:FecR domain-containing protein n=1 Tax=Kerstersia gyiorum TaxID=206506 RepID=UPI002096D292|nr:FecR domain-containing protein [Kerstersia gyiorum]MCO7642577.1 FecR domain-containing protein [Pseudomonas sp. S 311-6]MCR4160340.1 FecR domain-containing protein [Kerstersia gyiorum]